MKEKVQILTEAGNIGARIEVNAFPLMLDIFQGNDISQPRENGAQS